VDPLFSKTALLLDKAFALRHKDRIIVFGPFAPYGWGLVPQPVFPGSVVEVCGHHLHTEPEPLSQRVGQELSPEFERLIMWCLEKDPERRPQSAREFRHRLAAIIDVPRWSQTDARQWWEGPGRQLVRDPADDSHQAVTRILDVDMDRAR
jgi:serine/threonine-protein kinase